jgi:hypothetical protein
MKQSKIYATGIILTSNWTAQNKINTCPGLDLFYMKYFMLFHEDKQSADKATVGFDQQQILKFYFK